MPTNAINYVDLPGTYSLLSTSPDEEIARDFILFGEPDVTVVVVDVSTAGTEIQTGRACDGNHRPARVVA
jgi:Fe2+ transport system protein B